MKIDFQYHGERSKCRPLETCHLLETTLFGVIENGTPAVYRVSTTSPNEKKYKGSVGIYTNRNNERMIPIGGFETWGENPHDLMRVHFAAAECLRRGHLPEDIDLAKALNDPEHEIK